MKWWQIGLLIMGGLWLLGGCIAYASQRQSQSYDPCAHGGHGIQIGLDTNGVGHLVNCGP
jgi:hypothetical protein